MFSSQTPARAGSKRPNQPAGQRHASLLHSPPRTPRLGGGPVPQVASPFSGQNVSRYGTPIATPRFGHRITHARVSPRAGGFGEGDMDVQSDYSFQPSTSGGNLSTKYYANRPELSVSLSAQLPREVQKVLTSADFIKEASSGGIDQETGYAYLLSSSTCFVWNCAASQSLYPTCYIFPLRPAATTDDRVVTSYASFVPYGAVREPGLIATSGQGEIRFWDSIGTGLSGAEHYHALQIDLAENEFVTGLSRYDSLIFVLITSSGRILKLTISSSNGRYQLGVSPFGGSGSTFSRMTAMIPFMGGSGPTGPGEAALSFALGRKRKEKGERDAWVLFQNSLALWRVSMDGWEQMEYVFDIHRIIESALGEEVRESQRVALSLLDIGLRSDGQVLVLISYPTHLGNSTAASAQELYTYAVARLAFNGSIAEVQSLTNLTYDMPRDARPGTAPKMVLLDEGDAVLVQFGAAVVVASLTEGAAFRQTLTLKSPWNRTLGCGIVKNGNFEVSLIVAQNGLLTFSINRENIHANTSTDQLKSTLEQAIFYGSMKENPFLFTISPQFDGVLDSAARSLSREIVTSQSMLMRPHPDLGVHLERRVELLRSLIVFINENGMAGHLSTSGKLSLSLDAEKIMVARDVWAHVNAKADSRSLLVDAIEAYLRNKEETFDEDPIRFFFKSKVEDFEIVAVELHRIIKSRAQRSLHVQTKSILPDANRLIITMFESVVRHRSETSKLYAIPEDDKRLPVWTSSTTQLNVVSDLFDATATLLTDRSRELGAVGRKDDQVVAEVVELRNQLCRLAEMVFWTFEERVGHLHSLAIENGDDRELQLVQDRFAHTRKHVVQQLVSHRLAPEAFALTEQYKDFRILAQLCNEPQAFEGQSVSGDTVSEAYIEKYEDAFAFELYRWYIDNGQLQKLLRQNELHAQTLSRFLVETPTKVAWIHYLASGELDKAAESLSQEASREQSIPARKVAFSLEKLCELAQLGAVDDYMAIPNIQGCNDQLELISTHEILSNEFHELIDHEAGSGLDPQEAVAKAANLDGAPAYLALFQKLVRQVLSSQNLATEDLIDLLTLKCNEADLLDGFVNAAHVLERSNDLQEGRAISARDSIRRRILIHDDWRKIRDESRFDAERTVNLQRTALFRFASKYKHYEGILPPSLDQPPSIPTVAEINARFTQLSNIQIEELRQDYEREHDALLDYITNADLQDVYAEILALSTQAPPTLIDVMAQ